MAEKVRYLLDANIFIQAHRTYYAFDICPGFWDSLVHHGKEGDLISIDRVCDELKEGDVLDHWKKEVARDIFLSSDNSETLTAYTDAVRWVQKQARFKNSAKSEFANDVDAWIIAFAKAFGFIVVTNEESRPNSQASVKIPDVCDALDIQWSNPFKMLRNLEIRYHWKASS
ncbi:MAG: DUF4411 family protein [Phycisphaerae bacterium]|nr:DUF4411 family protein [Phycisphaerae bacterium]